jgi:hypothetical protein
MARDGPIFGLLVVGVIVGTALLLAGEAFHGLESLVPAGGAVIVLSVGGLTAAIARTDPPADAH